MIHVFQVVAKLCYFCAIYAVCVCAVRYVVATGSHTTVSAGYEQRTAKLEPTFKSDTEELAVRTIN